MSNDQSEEKTDPASDKKLRDLRKRGIIATAPTASDYVGFAAALLTAILMTGLMVSRLSDGFDMAFNQLAGADTSDNIQALKNFLLDIKMPLLAILAAAATAGILFKIISQNGFVFAMERVQPKLDNINPMNGLKKLFNGDALANFAAALVRFVVLTAVVVALGFLWAPTLLNLDLCTPTCLWPTFWSIACAILIATAVVIIVTIFFDIAVQKAFFLIENRMTKTEVKRERKDMMGQPEIRQERRRLGREMVEGSESVGSNRAAIFFFWGDDVVAFAFHPVKVPLPKLAARARGAEASALLKAQFVTQGVPGFEHKDIVQASISGTLGESAKREIFMPLAGHLRQLYS